MRAYIFGIDIDAVTRRDAFERTLFFLHGQTPCIIVTPNAEILLEARHNAEFRAVLNAAQLSFPDGTGALVALRMAGIKAERITGVDFALDLIIHAAQHNEKVALVGGTPGRAVTAAEKFTKNHPGLMIHAEPISLEFTIHQNGTPVSFEMENEIVERLKKFSPAIILVAFGAPKQELWIKRILPKLPSVRISMGIGGGVDYWAGAVSRAPKIMQTWGLEWLWRLILQPWRIKRIFDAAVVFPALILAERLKGTR